MIIPAILENNLDEVKRKIKIVDELVKEIQIDIIDDTIIKGQTFLDVEKIKELNPKINYTVHLMVKDPFEYVKKLKNFKPFKTTKISNVSTVITQLIDDANNIKKFIDISKKLGYKIGFSINEDQDISILQPFINDAYIVQFMGVVPGKQGGELIPSVLDKITKFKDSFPSVMTQIDGGVNDYNFYDILKTGVDNIVIGSAIFNTENPKRKFVEFSNLFEEGRKTTHGRDSYN